MAPKKHTLVDTNTTSRHLWLAGLGLMAITQREAFAKARATVDGIGRLQHDAKATFVRVQSDLIDTVDGLRERIETGAGEIGHKVESLLTPVLAKLKPGRKAKASRRTRKPVARKTTSRKTASRRTAKSTTRAPRRARKA